MTRANARGIRQDCAGPPWPKQMRQSWRRLGERRSHHEDNVPGGAPLHRGYDAVRGGEGTECVGAPRRLEVFEGHLLDGAPNTLARIVDENIDRSEVRFDGCERALQHGGVAHIASIGARHGELLRQSAREASATGQQRDGISLRGEPASERSAITGTHAGDDTDRRLGLMGKHREPSFKLEETARGVRKDVDKNYSETAGQCLPKRLKCKRKANRWQGLVIYRFTIAGHDFGTGE
jgi:hypothetical protein